MFVYAYLLTLCNAAQFQFVLAGEAGRLQMGNKIQYPAFKKEIELVCNEYGICQRMTHTRVGDIFVKRQIHI